ncbi:hypothetical protein [Nitratireductor sp. GCM10026969]|uniref:hypothetical protein n=1 Tax=Nitratireductor sp. GCM10026969 TaxID=3252645 RepID=UPI0036192E68
MKREVQRREPLSFVNPNKALVVEQLDKLLAEWRAWLKVVEDLPDSPEYNPDTCTEVIKDGRDNIRKHDTLREKTLVFLASNFEGYDFLFANWPTPPHEYNLARKREIVPGWIHRLETLQACIEYARVPDGYWKSRGKQLVESMAGTGPEKAAELAATALKGG